MKKINPDNTKTIYVGGMYEVNKNSGGTVTSTKTFYPAGGAMRVDGVRYYVLKDNLGSASVVTNQSGTTVGEDRFYPFGETRFTTGTMQTDKLFTGQRDTGLGIYNYGARFYSPKLGRFLSADTIVPGYANPQNLNRFSYTLNNPVRYTDPSGHMAQGDWVGSCGICSSSSNSNTGSKPGTKKNTDTGPVFTPPVIVIPPFDVGGGDIGGPSGTTIIPAISPADFTNTYEFNALLAKWKPRSGKDWNALARRLGMDPNELSNNVHSCKQAAHVPPNGDVVVDDESGDIYYQGEYIGNAREGC